jgi:predicted transcriptional regulator
MKAVTISARIPEELSDQLSTLAEALQRNRSWVIEEALRGYIASEQQFLEAVDEGLREIEAGEGVEHEEVVALAAERMAQIRNRAAG